MDIFTACRTGNLDWLKQQTVAGTLPKLMQRDQNSRFPHERASAGGHLEVLKWLVLESGQPVDLTANGSATVQLATSNGHLDVVKWLVLDYSDWLMTKKLEDSNFTGQVVDVTADDNSAVRLAANNGHLDVVKWLVLEWPDTEAFKQSGQLVDVTSGANKVLRLAARNGHLDVIKWLVQDYADWLVVKKLEDPSFTGQPVDVTADNNDAVRWAARDGHLDVVKWLVKLSAEAHVLEWPKTEAFKQSGQLVDTTAKDNAAIRWAANNGHFDVVKWLVENYSDWLVVKKLEDLSFTGQPVDVTTTDANENSAAYYALKNHHVDLFNYLDAVESSVKVCGLDNFRMAMHALDGHLEAVKNLAKMMPDGLSLTEDDLLSLATFVRPMKATSTRKL